MSDNAIQQLPKNTIKLLTSTQTVTSVSTAVKELLENSIDAGAKIIQVRLENYGLDLIEIKDNGSGVSYENVQRMFLPGYTSKIKKFEDLDGLSSYGFRGEALAAICKISKVTITTKTSLDSLAMTYDIDSNGMPISSKPSHLNNGTVITITNLFSNIPVRKAYLATKKKMSEDIKLTEQIVQSLSLIHPELNISMIHNKCIVWKKNSVKGLKQSFMQVVTLKTVSKMDHITKLVNSIQVDLIIPKKKLNDVNDIFTNSSNAVYVYVNKRPVTCKYLCQPVQEHVFHHYRHQSITQKYAVSLISVSLPPQFIDVNLEPNKTKVLLKNQMDVIKVIDEVLINYYNNENFHCSELRKAVLDEELVKDMEVIAGAISDDNNVDENEREVKRPKLESGGTNKPAKEKQDEKFDEKNDNWILDIINDEYLDGDLRLKKENCSKQISSDPESLCSQINKANCVLATPDEVSELNAMLNDQNFQSLICSNAKGSVTRLVERNDLQCRPSEPKIVPEWTSARVENVGGEPNGRKNAEEIAAEMEIDADKWSLEMFDPMKGEKNETREPDDFEKNVSNFDLSMQSISSQLGNKEMKAFTKYARIMRPKIASEFPKLTFTQIAAILAERWKSLTPAEIKQYEKMAEIVDLNRKIHQEEKKEKIVERKESNKSSGRIEKNSDLKSFVNKLKKKCESIRPPRNEITLDTSINRIKEDILKYSWHDDGEYKGSEYKLIGRLQPSQNWLYVREKEIGHLRHGGLQEVMTYRKLLSSHEIPRKPLEKPISFNRINLGDELWNVFLSLETDYCLKSSRKIVTSDVIAKNGFRIEIEEVGGIVVSGFITETASAIPQFGISDLREALGLYRKNGEIGELSDCRPVSVQSYLANETVRLNQQQPIQQPEREEIQEILNTYQHCLGHLPPPNCLHSKKVFVPIYHIQD